MNGLVMLILMGMGAVGGWCAYALIRGGEIRQPTPDHVQRRLDKWDGTR